MRAHRLQRLAERGAIIAIIDDQRRAALPRQPRGQRADDANTRGRRFDNAAHRRITQPFGNDRVGHRLSRDRQKQRILTRHQPLPPIGRRADQLLDRQRIEKLIGNHEQRHRF